LSDDEWNNVMSRLRDHHILMPAIAHGWDSLDLHPLVRMHFNQRLRSTNENAWRLGHELLFRYFSELAPAVPQTIDHIQVLYRALRHGCEAKRHQEVLDDIFWKRILRGHEQFSWRILGLIQSDLSAVSRFFVRPWSQLQEGIHSKDAGFLIGQAAIYLGMTGRFREAIPLLRESVAHDLTVGHLFNASVSAGNLSHVLLLLGDFPGTIEAAEQSVKYADSSGDKDEMRISRTHLGHALYRAFRLDDAEAQFVAAEAIQREHSGEPLLFGSDGLQYGDVLIAQGRWSDAQARSIANLARRGRASGREPDGRAEDLLAAASANLAGIRASKTGHLTVATEQAEWAVAMLRDFGQMDLLPPGLLTRAELYSYQYRQHEALEDIEETLALCVGCDMRLYETDALVLQAEILAQLGRRTAASVSVARATALTAELSYRTHDSQLAILCQRLGNGALT
jgi:tetratricopeptide (TPR) repeat protein